MTSVSAKCGHVKRRLRNNEPLEGKTLIFALSVIENAEDELVRGIAAKLIAGEKLTDYEYHVFVEVILLHVRLGTRANTRAESDNATEGD